MDEGAYVRSLFKAVPLVNSQVEGRSGQWLYTGPGKVDELRAELSKGIGSQPGWQGTGAGWVYGEDHPRPWWQRIPGIDKALGNHRPTIRVMTVDGKASNSGLPASLKEEWRTVLVYQHGPEVRGFPNGEFLKEWAIGR